jgi:glycosidase
MKWNRNAYLNINTNYVGMGVHWFKEEVIYHILIDRFAGFKSEDKWWEPIFLGGNIKGIIEKLPYLQDLGITTLWISPFYETSEYHGYHITNFYKVEPNFGCIEDLKELISRVHELGMHIIADFVPNHCSKEHPYFKDAQEDKDSPYFDWFYFTKWPQEYLCFLNVKSLPKINLMNEKARAHVIGAAKYWLSLGLDGFRLDHVIGPPHFFWRIFSKEIKDSYPDAILIGEAWMRGIKRRDLKTINVRNRYLKWILGASSDSLFKEYIGELDGVLDFKFQELIRSYVNNPSKVLEILSKRTFPEDYFLPTFLDNHDMDRFLFQCGNDKEKLMAAARIQFKIDQPPIIYYGTEVGMTQSKPISGLHGDLQARQPMRWRNQDKALHNFYKKLIELRNSFGGATGTH